MYEKVQFFWAPWWPNKHGDPHFLLHFWTSHDYIYTICENQEKLLWASLCPYLLKVAGEVHDVLSFFLYYGYLSFVLTVLQIVSCTGMIEVAKLIFYFLRSIFASAKIAVIWKSAIFHFYLSNQPHNRVKCYEKCIVVNIHP